MKAFVDLYNRLDSTTKTTEKLAALTEYFRDIDPADGAWALYFLIGKRPKRLINTRLLRQWAAEVSELPDWLFEECYAAVGDLAETIALVLPAPTSPVAGSLTEWVEERLLPLRNLDEAEQRQRMIDAWRELEPGHRFVWNKLITGGLRVGVSRRLATRALAEVADLEPALIAHRLMGIWEPTPDFFTRLLSADDAAADAGRPYPFFLANPLEGTPEELGPIEHWQAEWKWDGIRATLIRRAGNLYLWSRGEELVTDRYPELHAEATALPDGTVLDGELVGWKDDAVLPFGELQRRIGRKTVGKKILQDVPVAFLAFDLLEHGGEDLRTRPLSERRTQLEQLLERFPLSTRILSSPLVIAENWASLADLRADSRRRNVEGLMLKRLDSAYGTGRETGPWWKWKIEPYTVDAVMIYAQQGHGRRAGMFTDYTFAVWQDGQLVPFAKAYSGLTNAEIQEVDRFVRQHTKERFGPVRSVTPELVFELAFENIQLSKRHKSGIAVRFPRIVRWRRDKRPDQADTLETVRAMIAAEPVPEDGTRCQ